MPENASPAPSPAPATAVGSPSAVPIDVRGLTKRFGPLEAVSNLTFSVGRGEICALVGPELEQKAKEACEMVILADDFGKYAGNKKLAKALSKQYDYFIAQGDMMGKVAGAFGRVLGPRGKMPNPKAGCVVNDKTDLKLLAANLKATARIAAKTSLIIQTMVGNEEMPEQEVAENVFTIYDQLIHHLPNEKNNIRSAYLKLTMGKPVKVV